jgi:hypothetical protein
LPSVATQRTFTGFSAARVPQAAPQANPVRFNGQLIDEINLKDRKKMELIDEYACSEALSPAQRGDNEAYLTQYEDLNEDLQHGVGKKSILGLMGKRIEQMWDKMPDKYKQKFKHFLTKARPPRQYSSSRLSQIESNQPETIHEESE